MTEAVKLRGGLHDRMQSTSKSFSELSGGNSSEIAPNNTNKSNMLRQWEFRTSKSILIWFDANISETEDNYRDAILELRHLVNTLQLFSDTDQCLDFITNTDTARLFFILSHHISENFAVLIHDFVQTEAIYILLDNKDQTERWMAQYPKIRGIYTSISVIIHEFRQLSPNYEQNHISTTCVPPHSELDLDELDQSFMYSVLLREILLEMDYDDNAKTNFFNLCRGPHSSNQIQAQGLDEMEKTYNHHSPIWWYIKKPFIYTILNKALRTEDIGSILKMGFYLKDLHKQIEGVYATGDQEKPITLYRGQGMSNVEFEKLKKNKSGLLAFNNFLSTTTDRQIAYSFAEAMLDETKLVGILFEIEIDPTKPCCPFASLNRISDISDADDEVLFSMNTVFRIVEFQLIHDRLWKVSLISTSDTDTKLEILTDRMREEIRGPSPLHRLGRLLVKMGCFDKAEETYNNLLGTLSETESNEQARIYGELGNIFYEQGDLNVALKYLEKARDIKRVFLPSNHPDLASTYDNIGSVYQRMGEYSKALSFYENALTIREQSLPGDHPDLANTFNNIGLVYSNLGDYLKALSYFKKTLSIQEKTLPSNHPDLSITYNNIGLVYDQMGDYSKALSYYDKTLGIRQKTLPSTHPLMASIYNNIAFVHQVMGDYSTARIYSEKTLEIQMQILPDHHPNLANTYHTLGTICHAIGEYTKALSYLEKSLMIRKNSLPDNHPDLATTYNTIGSIYMSMGRFSEALGFFEQTVDMYIKTLPSNHPLLADTFKNIGSVYASMGEYSKALLFNEKALKIQLETMPSNHPDLATMYNNIGLVYNSMGEYTKGLEYFNKTLEIQQLSLPKNHPSLGNTYCNLGWVYFSLKKYDTALPFYKRSLLIRKISLPHNHPSLAKTYNYIGTVHAAIGHSGFALDYYKDALKIQEKLEPLNHPSLGETYYNVALMYQSTGDYAAALSYYEKALEIQEKVLPATHPSLANTYSDLGHILCSMKKYEKALSYVKKGLDIQLTSLPKNHPSSAKNYYLMAMILNQLERSEEAVTCARKAVEVASHSIIPDIDQENKYRELLYNLSGLTDGANEKKTDELNRSVYPALLITGNMEASGLTTILQEFTLDDPITKIPVEQYSTTWCSNQQAKFIVIESSIISSEERDRLLGDFSSIDTVEAIYLCGIPPTSKAARDEFFSRFPKICIFSSDEGEVAMHWLLDVSNHFRRAGNELKISNDTDAARRHFQKATDLYERLQNFLKKACLQK